MSEDGRALTWLLAFVAAAGLGFGALVGIGCAIGANACPFTEPDRIATTDGRALWNAKCIHCHGMSGAGTNAGPSLVSGPSGSLTEQDLRAKIARGRPFAGMPRFKGELTDAQIAAVARYVLELREAS